MESDKNKKKSRRDFLIASGAIAGGLISVTLFQPFKALGEGNAADSTNKDGKNAKSDEDLWYGWAFDIEKCIGCGSCAAACKKENNVPTEPFYFRCWVEQYAISLDGDVKVESPNGGIDGFKQHMPSEDIAKSFFVPKACGHCEKSPCEEVCPVGASFLSPEGVVLADVKYCIGCGYCVQACPYGCRYLHPETHVVDKCTLCYHRITKGLPTACVQACPAGARIYGNLHDKNSDLMKFLREHDCHVLKPHLNTKPKLYFNALTEEVR